MMRPSILRLARIYGLDDAIRAFQGPVFGTCAGMILLDRRHLGLADLEVDRNAYGRQVRSFEADVRLGRPVSSSGCASGSMSEGSSTSGEFTRRSTA